jgi:ribosome biogenesis GTPase
MALLGTERYWKGLSCSGTGRQAPPVPAETRGWPVSRIGGSRGPGCAVQEAVKSGTLPAARLENFHRLVRELAFEQEKAEKGLVRSERKRWKGIAKFAKEINKGRGE